MPARNERRRIIVKFSRETMGSGIPTYVNGHKLLAISSFLQQNNRRYFFGSFSPSFCPNLGKTNSLPGNRIAIRRGWIRNFSIPELPRHYQMSIMIMRIFRWEYIFNHEQVRFKANIISSSSRAQDRGKKHITAAVLCVFLSQLALNEMKL